MANEGIMALPDMQGMQAPQPAPMPQPAAGQEPVFVSSADAYDAGLTALGLSTDPSQSAAVRKAIQESISDLDLTATEAADLIDVFEYLARNPSAYPQVRQQLIDSDMMEPDDLPEQYDPQFIGIALMAINEYMSMLARNVEAPMQMSPDVEGLPPMGMARGGLADMAQYLASKGRYGDTMLAHITPQEAQMLRRMGGSGTINPQTGLPEFFLKKVFKGVKNVFKKVKNAVKKALQNPIVRMIATVALTVALPGVGTAIGVSLSTAASAAIAAGTVTLASGGNVKDALVAGAMGYVGGGGGIGGFNPSQAIAGQAASALNTSAAGALAQGIGAGAATAGTGVLLGMKPKEAATAGLLTGLAVGAKTAYQNARAAPPPAGQPAPRAYAYDQGPPPQGAPRWEPESPFTDPTASRNFAAESPPLGGGGGGGGAGTGSTWTGRVSDFVKSLAPGGAQPTFEGFKNAFLVNPNATGIMRYAPAALTGLGLSAATGGFKPQEVEEPLYQSSYTGLDYMRDNPEMFQGSLQPTQLSGAYNPVIETPSYGLQSSGTGGPQIPLFTVPMPAQTGVPMYQPPPGAITNMPGGIPQPYNMAGMYGYGQPQGYAKGGETRFPRKNGPINGPGTGTSDSIPAMLSDGEFVFTAKAVRNAGGGSRRKGARRMYKLMKTLESGGMVGSRN